MGKCCEFTIISKHHLISLLVPLLCMATNYTQKYELSYYNKLLRNKNSCEENNENIRAEPECKVREYPFFFNIFISKILSIFLVLLSKYFSYENNDLKIIETTQKRRYHLEVTSKCRKIKTALLVFVISCLGFLFKFENYVTYGEPNYIEIHLGVIFLVPILSFFILKKEIYRHHIFSFILSTIGTVLVCLSLLFIYPNKDIYSTKRQKFGEQMRHLFFSIYYSIGLVLIKYMYEKSFLSAFSFLFIDGILCITFPFILVGIKAIFLGTDYFLNNLKGILLFFYDLKIIHTFLFLFVFSFGYYISSLLTLYYFSPSLLVSTEILSPFFMWLFEIMLGLISIKDYYKIKKENENVYLVFSLKLIGFLVIIFSALVYNEILELHFCSLDKNIEKNIQKRGEEEIRESNAFNCGNILTRSTLSTSQTIEIEMETIDKD